MFAITRARSRHAGGAPQFLLQHHEIPADRHVSVPHEPGWLSAYRLTSPQCKGTASVPIVGGLLVPYVDWQPIFYINLGIGALAVTAAPLFVVESRDRRTQGLDLIGAGLLAGALFCLRWALIKTSTHPEGSAVTIGFLIGGAVLLALWAGRLATARHPLVPLSLFCISTIDAGIVVVIAVTFTHFGFLFYVMLYLQRLQRLQRLHGYSPVEAGLGNFPLTGLVGLSASIGDALGGRIARRLHLFAGLLLVAGGMLGLIGLQPNSSFGAMCPWFVVIGAGIGLGLVGATRAFLGSPPTENADIAAGIQQTSVQIGAALGTAVFGTVVTTRVRDVFRGLLLAHQVPSPLAAKLVMAKRAVAQGIAPVNDQLGAKLLHAVKTASFQTITEGMRMAFIIAACAAAPSLPLFSSGTQPSPARIRSRSERGRGLASTGTIGQGDAGPPGPPHLGDL